MQIEIPNQSNYAVASYSMDGKCLLMLAAPVAELLAPPSIKRLGLAGAAYSVQVHGWFKSEAEAKQLVNMLSPVLNPVSKARQKRFGTTVRDVETGQLFRSATEAAVIYGISKGAMSNHLNRRKGYERIHNMVFEKVTK